MSLNGELLWALIGFVLTLLVFSYLLGDNPLFRFVSALFVGVSAGYFAVILVYQVVLARLVVPLMQGSVLTTIPLLLSGLLLMKLSPRFTRLGNLPMAMVVGVGAAVAVGGAVLGTIFGQVKGALAYFSLQVNSTTLPILSIVEGIFFLVGTLASLAYFHFGAREQRKVGPRRALLTHVFAGIGQVFIAITLGAVFAGVLTAAMTALLERSDFVVNFITGLVR